MIKLVTFRAWLEEQTGRQDEVGSFARELGAMDPPPRAWTPTGVLNHIRRMDLAAEDEDRLARQQQVAVEDYRKHRGDQQEVAQAGEELPHPDEPPEIREMILAVQSDLAVHGALLCLIAQRLGVTPDEITEAVAYMASDQPAGEPDEEPEPPDFGVMWHAWSLAEQAGTVSGD